MAGRLFWAGTEPPHCARRSSAARRHFEFPAPWPYWTAGVYYEEGLYNFYNDQRHSGGRAFLRYRFLETSSFIVDDQGFVELYFGTGNEFWAGDHGPAGPLMPGSMRSGSVTG